MTGQGRSQESYSDSLDFKRYSDPLIGTCIDQYLIIRPLGQGGMGTVYLARDQGLDRPVAIKILRENLTRNSETAEQFKKEAKMMAQLGHPNIVGVITIGISKGRHYVVMPYLSGGSLSDKIRQEGSLSVDESLSIVRAVAEGLSAAHQLKIIHRDIKPENILIDQYGSVMVSDFGLAIIKSQMRLEESALNEIVGTPFTMSPEQCEGQEVDERSDIYALGITFYKMLTGHWPFDGDHSVAILMQHISSDIPDPRTLNSVIPEEILYLLQKMTAKNPSHRYLSIKNVLRDLDRYQQGDALLSLRERVEKKSLPSKRVLFFLIALFGISLCILMYLNESEKKGEEKPVQTFSKNIQSAGEPEKTIRRISNEISECRSVLQDSELGSLADQTRKLAVLGRYASLVDQLVALKGISDETVDFSQDLEDFRLEWASKISGEMIGLLVGYPHISDVLEKIKSYPISLIRLPRVSEYAYDLLVQHVSLLFETNESSKIKEAHSWVSWGWHLNVALVKKKELVEEEIKIVEKLKEYKEALTSTAIYEMSLERWKLAYDKVDSSLLDDAVLLIQSIMRVVEAHPESLRSPVLKQTIDEMGEDLSRWLAHQKYKSQFNELFLENKLEESESVYEQWQGALKTIEAKKAFQGLMLKKSLEKVAIHWEKGEVFQTLANLCHLSRCFPESKNVEKMRAQVLKPVPSQGFTHQNTSLLLTAAVRSGRGDFEGSSEILQKIKNRDDDENWAALLNEFQQTYVIWVKALKLVETEKWGELLSEMSPFLDSLFVPSHFRWFIGQAYFGLSKEYFAEENWSRSLEFYNLAKRWFPEQYKGHMFRDEIISSWAQPTFKEVSKALSDSDNLVSIEHLKKSIEDLARAILKIDKLVIQKNFEMRRVRDTAQIRYEDLRSLSHWLFLVDSSVTDREWETAFEQLGEAEKMHLAPKLTAALRKKILFSRALGSLTDAETIQEKAALSWEAWANRPSEDEAFLEKHRSIRKEFMDHVTQLIESLKPQLELFLNSNDLSQVQVLIGKFQKDLRDLQEDLKRSPEIQASDSFLRAQRWSRGFISRFKAAQELDKQKQISREKYDQYLSQAKIFQESLELEKSLSAYKNARLHSGHIDEARLQQLDSQISQLEKKVRNSREIGRLKKEERERKSKLKSLIQEASKAESQREWEKAIDYLVSFQEMAKPGDEAFFSDQGTLLDWQLRLRSCQQDFKDYRDYLDQVDSQSFEEAVEALERFIRLNSGNYYVSEGLVQREIVARRQQLVEENEEFRRRILDEVNDWMKANNLPQAQKVLIEALKRLKSDQILKVRLMELLTGDRIYFRGGEFFVGSEAGEGVEENETPPYQKHVEPFWLARLEVTNLQYQDFIQKNSLTPPLHWINGEIPIGQEMFPVHGISWHEASAYAQSVGARLPTEFEWEWAARSGKELRRWPWGNSENEQLANAGSTKLSLVNVFSFPEGRSVDGVLNMAGNVSEWTVSTYIKYPDLGSTKVEEITKGLRVVRGGSLFDNLLSCRTTARKGLNPDKRQNLVGFRLCWSSEGLDADISQQKE